MSNFPNEKTIDIYARNLAFYAKLCRLQEWSTDVIHSGVIEHSLREYAAFLRDNASLIAAAPAVQDTLDAISALFPDDATHKYPETGESLIDNVRDLIREREKERAKQQTEVR